MSGRPPAENGSVRWCAAASLPSALPLPPATLVCIVTCQRYASSSSSGRCMLRRAFNQVNVMLAGGGGGVESAVNFRRRFHRHQSRSTGLLIWARFFRCSSARRSVKRSSASRRQHLLILRGRSSSSAEDGSGRCTPSASTGGDACSWSG